MLNWQKSVYKHHGKDIYPSDIAIELNLDYDYVLGIFEELVAEGKIK